jgi:hypothetical protein
MPRTDVRKSVPSSLPATPEGQIVLMLALQEAFEYPRRRDCQARVLPNSRGAI